MTNQRETAKSKVLTATNGNQFRVKSQRHLSREDGQFSPLGIKFKARDFKLPRSVIPEMESLWTCSHSHPSLCGYKPIDTSKEEIKTNCLYTEQLTVLHLLNKC